MCRPGRLRRRVEAMANMNMVQALNSAMDIMLERDPRVVIFGEDVGYFGGVFRVTDGLQRKYGEHRVLDTPIAEGGIVAAAIGMGVNGLKPVAEIQFADYIYPAFDQVVSELARLRYRTAGEFSSAVTIRTPCGGGIRGGQTHSQSPEGIFTHVCGMTTTPCPSAAPWLRARERTSAFLRMARWFTSRKRRCGSPESTLRSSTCARWLRWMSTRCARRCARPGGAWWCTRPRGSAA